MAMFNQATSGLLYFEDFRLDEPVVIGGMTVTREAIKDFARLYDPQPMHLDEEKAKATIVGGLCASGFHTCCLMMRMLCDGFLLRTASLGAPGLDDLKWLKPVRPDDVLRVRIVATDKRVMASRPNVGMLLVTYEVLNQADEVVLTSPCNQLMRVREPQAAQAGGTSAQRPPAAELVDMWDGDPASSPRSTGPFFEERVIGDTRTIGHQTFERDEIIAFAKRFDPQPFHLDEAAGKASLFGGLAASGWHTAAHYIRCVVADRQADEARQVALGKRVPAYGPSPGMKNLRWRKPVMAGDTLEYRLRVTGKRDLKSRPDRGLLLSQTQARNQHGEVVFSCDGAIFVERLPSA